MLLAYLSIVLFSKIQNWSLSFFFFKHKCNKYGPQGLSSSPNKQECHALSLDIILKPFVLPLYTYEILLHSFNNLKVAAVTLNEQGRS